MYIKNVIKLFKNLLMRFYAKDYYTTKNFHQTKMLYLCFLNFYCLMNFLYKSEVEHKKVTIEKKQWRAQFFFTVCARSSPEN